MYYGLESEAEPVKMYEAQTNSVLFTTGHWVNPYIACLPDGLLGEDSLLEIKSVKNFHDHRINEVIDDNGTLVSKDILKRK